MKRIGTIVIFTLAVFFFQACSQPGGKDCISPDVIATLDTFQVTRIAFETQQAAFAECIQGAGPDQQSADPAAETTPQPQGYAATILAEEGLGPPTETPVDPASLLEDEENPKPDMLWYASFDTGNLSEFQNANRDTTFGEFTQQGNGSFSIVT